MFFLFPGLSVSAGEVRVVSAVRSAGELAAGVVEAAGHGAVDDVVADLDPEAPDHGSGSTTTLRCTSRPYCLAQRLGQPLGGPARELAGDPDGGHGLACASAATFWYSSSARATCRAVPRDRLLDQPDGGRGDLARAGRASRAACPRVLGPGRRARRAARGWRRRAGGRRTARPRARRPGPCRRAGRPRRRRGARARRPGRGSPSSGATASATISSERRADLARPKTAGPGPASPRPATESSVATRRRPASPRRTSDDPEQLVADRGVRVAAVDRVDFVSSASGLGGGTPHQRISWLPWRPLEVSACLEVGQEAVDHAAAALVVLEGLADDAAGERRGQRADLGPERGDRLLALGLDLRLCACSTMRAGLGLGLLPHLGDDRRTLLARLLADAAGLVAGVGELRLELLLGQLGVGLGLLRLGELLRIALDGGRRSAG